MTDGADLVDAVYAWLAADPDPATRAELIGLDDAALTERFSTAVRFGTAGLRGPVRAGPSGMNRLVVRRTTEALAAWLRRRSSSATTVVVGRDARHGSAEFAAEASEVLRRRGFDVVRIPGPVPTPVVAHATRSLRAAAGIMITASHNPPGDNGYKVYLDGDDLTRGAQLVSPADTEIEALIGSDEIATSTGPTAPHTAADSAAPVQHADPRADEAVAQYLRRLAHRFGSGPRDVRVALTAMHGVGGATATAALRQAGVADVIVVDAQFEPDPDFPTVSFPNPEEPGAVDLLTDLARRSGADVAIALDPDADRCAVGAEIDGEWRMLTGDETGALLADHLLTRSAPTSGDDAPPLVASTIVSGSLVERVCADRGARFTRTLTGFKWLVRAGDGLVYAYEEAIGHCVDPTAVRDKDGIATAVAIVDLIASRATPGAPARRVLADALDGLADRHGVHLTAGVSHRTDDVTAIAAVMDRLRSSPPVALLEMPTVVEDLALRGDGLRTDAVAVSAQGAGLGARIVVRPSGTEPKIKCYLEIALAPSADRDAARAQAQELLERLRAAAVDLLVGETS